VTKFALAASAAHHLYQEPALPPVARGAYSVSWWLLVLATFSWWLSLALLQWLDCHSGGPGGFWTHEVPIALLFAALGLLPYVALTVVRWIATGRWRFGPRL
jgi:hypothetical protein